MSAAIIFMNIGESFKRWQKCCVLLHLIVVQPDGGHAAVWHLVKQLVTVLRYEPRSVYKMQRTIDSTDYNKPVQQKTFSSVFHFQFS